MLSESDAELTPRSVKQEASPQPPLIRDTLAEVSSSLRRNYAWTTIEVNTHERALVINERTRFELEIGPLIDQVKALKMDLEIMQCDNRYHEDWNKKLVEKLREHGMAIPRPEYNPAHHWRGSWE